MKIAVNTRLLLKGRLEGVGWFTAETLRRITCSHPEHQFLFLFDRPFSEEFIFSGNITPIVISPESRHPVLWYKWFEFSVPAVLKKMKADFFLSPDGYLSLAARVPSLPVIHDIGFMHFPEFNPWLTGSYYRHFFPKFASKAVRIATVSEYSKQDIKQTFNIPGEKIDVVYNGANLIFNPLPSVEKINTRTDFTGGHEYFLFVGSFHERKNICGLLEAYDTFRRESGIVIKLVLAGEKMYSYNQMDRTLKKMNFREDVIFTGYLEPEVLRRLYGAACAMIYIPWFEGFGIPVLEAMHCDTPVIISSRTALPEIAGDAAHQVDPSDLRSVVEGMTRLAFDETYRNKLVDRAGIVREKYSWDLTARLLWESIERSLTT
jgi:glycosyltransferase involved in cell wall biosynthesis